MIIKDLLSYGKSNIKSDTASLDAEILLAYVLNVNRVFLKTWPEKEVSSDLKEKYYSLIERRRKKEPIAYIVNKKQFWDFDFYVNEDVLIPRPETEQIIEIVQKIEKKENILELGAGSGAIILTIAKLFPNSKCLAVDNSEKALDIVKLNKESLKINNVSLLNSNWFEKITGTFDIIISNPPYIGENEIIDLDFEPKSALISKNDGFHDLEIIIKNAKNFLKGYIILEHGYQQGKIVRDCLLENNYKNIKTYLDLAGLERITVAIF